MAGERESAEYRAVDGPVDIGVGTNDHRVLAPEFEAVRDQALPAADAMRRPVLTDPVNIT